MWSLLAVLVSEFRWCFTLCLFIILLVQFRLLSGHLFGGIAALSVNNLFSLYFVYLLHLFISRFGFKTGICLLIAPVPVHCFSITFLHMLLLKLINALVFHCLYSTSSIECSSPWLSSEAALAGLCLPEYCVSHN